MSLQSVFANIRHKELEFIVLIIESERNLQQAENNHIMLPLVLFYQELLKEK